MSQKTVNEVVNQLKLAKNKDASLIFRLDGKTFFPGQMVEVIQDKNGSVRFPELGETGNAVAVTLVTSAGTTATTPKAPVTESE